MLLDQLLNIISCFLYSFFLSCQNLKAILIVSAQGDAGQSGLSGTLGPAGKTVSTSSTCWNTVVIFVTSDVLMCCFIVAQQGERGDQGEVGPVGPIGEPVSILPAWISIVFILFSYVHFKLNLFTYHFLFFPTGRFRRERPSGSARKARCQGKL